MSNKKNDRLTIVLSLIATAFALLAIDPKFLEDINFFNVSLLKFALYTSSLLGSLFIFSYALSIREKTNVDVGLFSCEEVQNILYNITINSIFIIIIPNLIGTLLHKIGLSNTGVICGIIGAVFSFKLVFCIFNYLGKFIILLGKIANKK